MSSPMLKLYLTSLALAWFCSFRNVAADCSGFLRKYILKKIYNYYILILMHTVLLDDSVLTNLTGVLALFGVCSTSVISSCKKKKTSEKDTQSNDIKDESV